MIEERKTASLLKLDSQVNAPDYGQLATFICESAHNMSPEVADLIVLHLHEHLLNNSKYQTYKNVTLG